MARGSSSRNPKLKSPWSSRRISVAPVPPGNEQFLARTSHGFLFAPALRLGARRHQSFAEGDPDLWQLLLGHEGPEMLGQPGQVGFRGGETTERAPCSAQVSWPFQASLPTFTYMGDREQPLQPARRPKWPTCVSPLKTLVVLAFCPFCVKVEDCLCGTTLHSARAWDSPRNNGRGKGHF